ncbi:MAG: DUF1934 domain-containing protein [Lachnospiraceae bacterium]|nr:DUF1934 domain-containing protein [Lachnospiraceae bacterium]
MNKNVKIKIVGAHGENEDRDVVKSECTGLYYDKNGKLYLKYTETDLETRSTRNALIKVAEPVVTVEYKGATDTFMAFEPGKTTKSMYITPMGSMPIEIKTESLTIELREDSLEIYIHYQISLSGSEMTPASIHIYATE